MTIGVKCRRAGGQECLHVVVLARLLKEESVVGLVLLVGEDRGDVDDVVVAVLHGEDVHYPLPRPFQVASVHGHNLYVCDRDGLFGDLFQALRLGRAGCRYTATVISCTR